MLLSGVYPLASGPLVCAVADNFLERALVLANEAKCEVSFLAFPMWYAGDLRGCLSAIWKTRKKQKCRVTWLCNAERERRMLRAFGQSAFFCNQNLFCNECEFRPMESSIAYDAIYTARLDDYKRIWLASNVKSLRIITANPQDRSRLTQWNCDHAIVNSEFMGFHQVATEISRSKCGLALSAKEGGMFAVTEYLLCGRPVVSTKSRGGRDFWLNDFNSRIVSSTPQAVAESVAGINLENDWAQEIRSRTIVQMNAQRKILYNVIQKSGSSPAAKSPDEMDGPWLRGRFVNERDLPDFFLKNSNS